MWSEDTTFHGTRKTQYEEYIFRLFACIYAHVNIIATCMHVYLYVSYFLNNVIVYMYAFLHENLSMHCILTMLIAFT